MIGKRGTDLRIWIKSKLLREKGGGRGGNSTLEPGYSKVKATDIKLWHEMACEMWVSQKIYRIISFLIWVTIWELLVFCFVYF